MSNQRIVLQNQYPQLHKLGISCFGHYINRTPQTKIEKDHHGSCYEICYLANGMQPYCIHTKTSSAEKSTLYRLYGGEVFITKPYEFHSTDTFQQLRGSLYWIQLDSKCPSLLNHAEEYSNFLKEALASLNTPVLRIPKSISSRLTEAFDLMMIPDQTRYFRGCQLLSLFILELADFNQKKLDENYHSKSLSAKILESISFIENNLLNPELSVQMIADHLHLSRSYMMTAFRNEIGMTIHEYILRSKIDHARELLDNYSITETAFLLNFSSSQHFSRVFKEHTGMTPGHYINRLQK